MCVVLQPLCEHSQLLLLQRRPSTFFSHMHQVADAQLQLQLQQKQQLAGQQQQQLSQLLEFYQQLQQQLAQQPQQICLQHQYQTLKQLGAGGQGTVWLVDLLSTAAPEHAALKKVPCKSFNQINEALKEAKCLSQFNHCNIIGCKGFFVEAHEQHCNLCMCMEYCQNGTIEDHVGLHGRPNNKCAITWAHQVASVLVYLHKQGLIHRDLKMANVLLDARLMCKVADFGLLCGQAEASQIRDILGTPAHFAPELLSS